MERLGKEHLSKKLGGGMKDKPLCEHCGRPVRISSKDYTRDEILCVNCASEIRKWESEEYESSRD